MTDYDDPPDLDDVLAEQLSHFHPGERAGSSAPIGSHVVDWGTLKDADARAAWDSLRAWVEWFTVRYQISESLVPVCWFRHGDLVEELSALHTAHTVAFDASDAGFGPIGWHERLSLTLPRLRHEYAGGCTRGHNHRKPRSWANAIDEQEWDAWADRTHARGGAAASRNERKNNDHENPGHHRGQPHG